MPSAAISSDEGVTGDRPAGVDLVNRYMRQVHLAAATDRTVCRAFFDAANLLAPPSSLMRPSDRGAGGEGEAVRAPVTDRRRTAARRGEDENGVNPEPNPGTRAPENPRTSEKVAPRFQPKLPNRKSLVNRPRNPHKIPAVADAGDIELQFPPATGSAVRTTVPSAIEEVDRQRLACRLKDHAIAEAAVVAELGCSSA